MLKQRKFQTHPYLYFIRNQPQIFLMQILISLFQIHWLNQVCKLRALKGYFIICLLLIAKHAPKDAKPVKNILENVSHVFLAIFCIQLNVKAVFLMTLVQIILINVLLLQN